jgi:TonB family protein
MKDKNGSEGNGENGIGDGPGHGMGNGPGDGTGVGNDPGPYGKATSQAACQYCPDPPYSEEARKEKLQGMVTLRVLVGVDGRVKEVQITRRLGLGLDENAVQAVRSWQFIPAKDAARRPVASWITIETLFRLY